MIQASNFGATVLYATSYFRIFISVLIYLFIYLFLVCTLYSSRRKRSSNNMVFTSDMVHILPGFPKKSPDDPTITLLAFYLQHPQGSSDNTVNKDVLKAIVESDMSSLEGSIGGTILRVEALSSTSKGNGNDDESEEELKPTSAIIGASVGGVLSLVIIVVVVFVFKRRNR